MSGDRSEKTRFAAGNRGRPVGARNRLQHELVKALADDFKENGVDAIRICRVERPADYLKIVVSVLPKEFVFTENPLGDLADDELDAVVAMIARKRRGETDEEDLGTEH